MEAFDEILDLAAVVLLQTKIYVEACAFGCSTGRPGEALELLKGEEGNLMKMCAIHTYDQMHVTTGVLLLLFLRPPV